MTDIRVKLLAEIDCVWGRVPGRWTELDQLFLRLKSYLSAPLPEEVAKMIKRLGRIASQAREMMPAELVSTSMLADDYEQAAALIERLAHQGQGYERGVRNAAHIAGVGCGGGGAEMARYNEGFNAAIKIAQARILSLLPPERAAETDPKP